MSLTDTVAITPNASYGLRSVIPSKIVPIIPTNPTELARVLPGSALSPTLFSVAVANVLTRERSVMGKMIVATTRMNWIANYKEALVVSVPVHKSVT